jgi:hypothetical protein
LSEASVVVEEGVERVELTPSQKRTRARVRLDWLART